MHNMQGSQMNQGCNSVLTNVSNATVPVCKRSRIASAWAVSTRISSTSYCCLTVPKFARPARTSCCVGRSFMRETCGVCAEVCAACAQSCEAMGDDSQMKACAEECRRCAESCKRMAAMI